MKLLHKLLAILLGVTLVPMSVTVYLLIQSSQRDIIRDMLEIQRLIVQNLSAEVDEFMSTSVKNLLYTFEGTALIKSETKMKAKMMKWSISQNLRDFRILSLLYPNGEFVLESQYLPDYSIPRLYKYEMLVTEKDVKEHHKHILYVEALKYGKGVFSPIYWNKERNEPLITYTYPLTDGMGGRVRYIISAEISLRGIQQLLSRMHLARGSSCFVIDSNGIPVAGIPLNRPWKKNKILLEAEKQIKNYNPRLLLGNIKFDFDVGADKDEIFGTFAMIEDLRWHVILIQPKQAVLINSHAVRNRIILFSLLIFLLVSTVGIFYAKNISNRVKDCVKGAHAIAKGDFTYKINDSSKDEIGVLAATFNDMGNALNEYRKEVESWNKELKRLVEERTEELRKTQLQLFQSSKMMAIGQLGAGIAHEISNPLTGILGQAQLLKRKIIKLKNTDEHFDYFIKYIESIEKESIRCKVIINSLSKLAPMDDTGMSIIDLNESINNLMILFENRLQKGNIEVQLQLQENLPKVRGNETKIQQVHMNIITNAYQAMPDGGVLKILTYSDDSKYVSVEIIDTGKGIPEEHLDRIFEPFFTTKDIWSNTGLGLAVCYAIVKDHDGDISVESTPKVGSCFRVRLPIFNL